MARLSDVAIRSLPVPPKGQKTYACDSLPGFGVRVSQGGTKTFVLVYGKSRIRISLGRYPLISLADARQKARQKLAHRELHGDASTETMHFDEALRLFLTVRCAQRNKPATAKETTRLLNRHFLAVLGDKEIEKITAADLHKITDGLLDTPSEANHAFTAARTLFRWLSKRRYIPHNPLDGAEMPAVVRSRSRVLSPSELPAILATAASSGSYGAMVECIFLTAQRDGQLANLHRDFIDADQKTITWPARLMKSGREHTIPYTDRIARILDTLPSPLLFPTQNDPSKPFSNWSNCKKRFDKACPMPHWTLHDARRSFSTHAASLGILPHITDLILDHSPIELSGVRGIYNKHRYIEEMREAVVKWEEYLNSLVR